MLFHSVVTRVFSVVLRSERLEIGRAGVFRDLLEQRAEMAEPAPRGLGIEDFRVIEFAEQAAVSLGDIHVEIEHRRAGRAAVGLRIGGPLEIDAAGVLAELAGLEIESDGEERRAAQVARNLEPADEIAEEVLLMLGGIEDERLAGGDLIREWRGVADAAAKRHHVRGIREQRLAALLGANFRIGCDTDDDVILAGEPVEQHAVRGEEEHEKRASAGRRRRP